MNEPEIFGLFGKTPLQAFEMLQQFNGDNTMSRTGIYEWYKKFKEGHEEVKDDFSCRKFQQAGNGGWCVGIVS